MKLIKKCNIFCYNLYNIGFLVNEKFIRAKSVLWCSHCRIHRYVAAPEKLLPSGLQTRGPGLPLWRASSCFEISTTSPPGFTIDHRHPHRRPGGSQPAARRPLCDAECEAHGGVPAYQQLLFNHTPLSGEQKPSELLAKMLRLCPRGHVNNDLFNYLYLNKLPRELRFILTEADRQTSADTLAVHRQRLSHDAGTAALAAVSLEEPEDELVVAAVKPSDGKGQRGGGSGQRGGGASQCWQKMRWSPVAVADSISYQHKI